jgi:hypothetical protein
MGCTDCTRSGGCETRKGEERELLDRLLPELYPTRRWGEPDDLARHGRGVTERDSRRIARRASEALKAPTYVQAGGEDEACEYIYVLCVGRAPGLWELKHKDELDVPDGDSIRERYLRVALSTMAKVATLEEVAFELDLDRSEGGAGDLYVIREKPRNGVYDPILLKRTRALVDLIVDEGFTYLDYGVIENPPDDFDGSTYEERWGKPPGIVNYLFYPQPPNTESSLWIPRG